MICGVDKLFLNLTCNEVNRTYSYKLVSPVIPGRIMKLHRYIEQMKADISKYNIRYREIKNETGFPLIKIKRIFSAKQRVTLEDFDKLREAVYLIKRRRQGGFAADNFEYLDRLYSKSE